jgi:hypothetical protein
MDWKLVFSDIHQWMQDSNEKSQQFPITTDEYWEWVIHSTGQLGNKYNNHPLVIKFLSSLIEFQDDNRKKVSGGK